MKMTSTENKNMTDNEDKKMAHTRIRRIYILRTK
jgi:hypothetical protein